MKRVEDPLPRPSPLLFAFAFASVSCRWIPTSATMRRRYIFDQIDPPLIRVASPPKFFIHRLLVRFWDGKSRTLAGKCGCFAVLPRVLAFTFV